MITQFRKFNDAESHMISSSLGKHDINALMKIIYLYSRITLFSRVHAISRTQAWSIAAGNTAGFILTIAMSRIELISSSLWNRLGEEQEER